MPVRDAHGLERAPRLAGRAHGGLVLRLDRSGEVQDEPACGLRPFQGDEVRRVRDLMSASQPPGDGQAELDRQEDVVGVRDDRGQPLSRRRPHGRSGRAGGPSAEWLYGARSRTLALRVVRSVRRTATRATFSGCLQAVSRSWKGLKAEPRRPRPDLRGSPPRSQSFWTAPCISELPAGATPARLKVGGRPVIAWGLQARDRGRGGLRLQRPCQPARRSARRP